MRWLLPVLLACGGDKDSGGPSETGGPGPVPLVGPLLLITETSTGRLIFRDTATDIRVGTQCLTELHPEQCAKGTHGLSEPCLMFGAVPETVDGEDVLTLSYTLRNPSLSFAPGAAARIRPGHPPVTDWVITQLHIPEALQASEGLDCTDAEDVAQCHLFGNHIAVPAPSGEIIVADTSNSRILWVRPPEDGSETGEVTAILSQTHPDWGDAMFINHLQRIETDDATWLLATFKGQKSGAEGSINQGRIVLWDITDPAAPASLWTYPGAGKLAAVHHGAMYETPRGPRLLYAHSLGASESATDGLGAVGMAEWNGADPPVYLGDGVLSDTEALGFVRAVSYSEEAGGLLITDSGCENAETPCGRTGKVIVTDLPRLVPLGTSGAWSTDHAHQTIVDLTREPFSAPEDLSLPFSAALLSLDDLGRDLGETALGQCP